MIKYGEQLQDLLKDQSMTIKFHTAATNGGSSHPMDVANIDESERAPCSAADSPGKHSIGIAWNVPQTPHYDPEQAGPTPEGALGQGGGKSEGKSKGKVTAK